MLCVTSSPNAGARQPSLITPEPFIPASSNGRAGAGPLSLREISVPLGECGFVTANGAPYEATSVRNMLAA